MNPRRQTLSFGSVLKLATLLGVGYGLVCIPLFVLFLFFRSPELVEWSIIDAAQLIVGGVLQGVLTGFVLGLFGYPFYWWVAQKRAGIMVAETASNADSRQKTE